MKPFPVSLTRASSPQEVILPEALGKVWKQCVLDHIKLPKTLIMPPQPMQDDRFWHGLIHSQRDNIMRLWEAFNTERGAVTRYLMDPKREAIGYLLAFHLANQARLLGCLQRVHQRGPLMEKILGHDGTLRFFDVGAGTGALSQLFAYLNTTLGQAKFQVDLIESRNAFISIAEQGIRMIDPRATITSHKMRIEKGHGMLTRLLAEAQDDLIGIGLGYVWNEISSIVPAARATKHILSDLAQSSRKAFLVLMEPSNQNIARSAMAFRDELVSYGYQIVYPCPQASSPCPMNDLSRDWCYSEFGFDRPRVVEKVDKLLDIQRARVGSSCFLMVTPALADAWKLSTPAPKSVVVGRPIARKHPKYPTYCYLLCTQSGLTKTKPVPRSLSGLRGELLDEVQEKVTPTAAASETTAPEMTGRERTEERPRREASPHRGRPEERPRRNGGPRREQTEERPRPNAKPAPKRFKKKV